MPTFCRHNRFIERCPICSKTLPGNAPAKDKPARARGAARAGSTTGARRRPGRADGVRVVREVRAADDGFHSDLIPGVRASQDAERLAQEIAFACGRLLALAAAPPGLYEQARELGAEDIGYATWICFLIAYLSPLQGEDPFEGIREALEGGEMPSLEGIPLGPRTQHDPARGSETLLAYRQWVERSGGAGPAFTGDESWSPERRFERVFERMTLPGFGRSGRYDLLVTLGRLGLFEMRAGSLQLAGGGAASAEDPTMLAAKRVFGIGDPLLLERRAGALAQAVSAPVEALDLALANWAAPERATLGMDPQVADEGIRESAREALGL